VRGFFNSENAFLHVAAMLDGDHARPVFGSFFIVAHCQRCVMKKRVARSELFSNFLSWKYSREGKFSS